MSTTGTSFICSFVLKLLLFLKVFTFFLRTEISWFCYSWLDGRRSAGEELWLHTAHFCGLAEQPSWCELEEGTV